MNSRMMDLPETNDPFPTPAELDALRRVDVTPEVNAALATIKTSLVKNGPGVVTMDWPSEPARKEVARILVERGWHVTWESEQREGTWARVVPR